MEQLRDHDPLGMGPYRLVGRLGSGGMGQVYLGRGPGDAWAAVKVIHPAYADDPQFRVRFSREVATVRGIRASWSAALLDADPTAPTPWLATEYVAGCSVEHQVVAGAPLPAASVGVLALRMAEALAELHAAGVVHRDVKPSNVLVAPDGPRLIDFGVARAVDATMITQTGTVVGPPGYMSPEQAMGQDAGAPSDVFSLAAVLVFAARGVGPFGRAEQPVVMLRRIVDDEPDLDDVPEALRPVLTRCLAKDADARPAAADLVDELAELVDEGQGWPPPDLIVPDDPEDAPPPPRRRRHRRGVLLATAGAGVAVLAVLALVLTWTPTVLPGAAEPVELPVTATVPVASTEQLRQVAACGDRLLVTGGSLLVLDPADGRRVGEIDLGPTGTSQTATLECSPDGRSAHLGPGPGPGLTSVELASGAIQRRAQEEIVTAVAETDEGPIAMASARDMSSSAHRVGFAVPGTGSMRVVATVDGFVSTMAVTPDGATMYVTTPSGPVRAVDVATGTVTAVEGSDRFHNSSVLSPDGERLHVGGLGVLTIDLERRAVDGPLIEPNRSVIAVEVTPDGERLLALGGDGMLVVHDPATGSRTAFARVATDAKDLAVSPAGDRAYVATGSGVEIVDLRPSAMWAFGW